MSATSPDAAFAAVFHGRRRTNDVALAVNSDRWSSAVAAVTSPAAIESVSNGFATNATSVIGASTTLGTVLLTTTGVSVLMALKRREPESFEK